MLRLDAAICRLCILSLVSVFATAANADIMETQIIGAVEARQQYPTIDGVDDQTGQVQRIAVFDTGIDFDHPGLTNTEGHSRVVAGINFAPGGTDASPDASDWNDQNGHGTFIAGIAGSSLPQRIGIAPRVEFVSVRVANAQGQTSLSDLADGLEWAVANREALNITAVNVSIGTDFVYSDPSVVPNFTFFRRIETAFEQLEAADVVVAASAGNGGSTTGLSAPGILNHNITVGSSTDSDDQVAGHSNRNDQLDLLAPGSSLQSLWKNGGTSSGSGTSFATPFVAAASVLVREMYLNYTDDLSPGDQTFQQRVLELLQQTGHTIHDSATGLDFQRLDVLAALRAIEQAFKPSPDLTGAAGLPDGVVDQYDLDLLLDHWQSSGPQLIGDLNQDLVVNAVDLGLLLSKWGPQSSPTPIPEPASIGLLLLGWTALSRRRPAVGR